MKCTTFNKTATVNTQHECQANCDHNSECVGILYSYKINFTQYCYICKDDNLRKARNDFGFYRRSGNVQGYALTFFYVMTKPIVPLFLYILVSY